MVLGVALAVAATMACNPIAGAAGLWANPDTRYVIVGEIHGTTEIPAFFGDLVCAARASGRPLVVALEATETEQGAVDRFIASDGGAAARQAFLQSAIWTFKLKDGRSSRAYLELFDRLRVLKASGAVAAVVATRPAITAATSQNEGNALMADRYRAAGARFPNALVLALVGNFHASKSPLDAGSGPIVPAAADLPRDQTLSLNVVTAGKAWNCDPDLVCEPRDWTGAAPGTRAVRLGAGAPNYDGEIDLGVPTTASPPASP